MTLQLGPRLLFVLLLWSLFAAAALNPSLAQAYDGQAQATLAYDTSGKSSIRYDAVSALSKGEEKTVANGHGVPVAKFPEFLAAKSGVTILEREGNVIIGSFKGANGEARVITELVRDGDTLILRGTHIEGQGTLKEALSVAKQFGREQGAKKVIIESGARTTGKNPGHVPRPITIETGL